ncbi:alginate lyase family protein [Paenibacillus amylolyticus]|uniref:alginate lyase family protein n=1 Tax=Paenibacillus amylolyticus TaxID=1451 RepID=UPI002499EA62|nr:alginate lyase family protein [Paenibacillus amylolyticus]WFA88086.1 heparinase II/III family protein [Paenibacillus amylolyticus]
MSDFYLSATDLQRAAQYYEKHFPEEARNSLTIANRAILNEFIVPYTNDLNRWIPMGTPVDWLHNPTNDLEFTWGINRHWHMLDLGKAYLMKGNPLYVTAFIDHFRSWRQQNPVPVNLFYDEAVFFQKPGPWRLLETGLRVQSWISAYKYMEASSLIDEGFQAEFRQGLDEHAEFLTRYLGSTEINHAIMHMQGLFMIATFYHQHPRSPYWRQVAMERLELCLLHQLGEEGIQVELTTHYHNASIEMFGTPYRLGEISGHPFSAWYARCLRQMAAFTEALIRPDHQSTGIGDSDWVGDGRQRLTLLGAILDDDDLVARGTDSSECLWLLGVEKYERCLRLQASSSPVLSSRAFPQTGYYVMRDKYQYLFFDAAGMGGAHGHADALNVEWMWKNQLFFTDTGRYTYEEGKWRRYFKSTRAHNTVTVDGLDQTPYLSTQQWGEPEAQATTLRWESNDSYHFIDASQDGYTHLPDPVTHRRWMLAGVEIPILLIVDWLEAEAEHTLEQRFHLHPQADIALKMNEAGEMTADMSYEASSITLTMQWVTAGIGKGAFALTEQPGWVSEVYGSKSETSVIQGKTDFSGKVGILTLCLPADHTDQVTRVTTCQLEPDLMRLALSYVQGEEKGYIVIDNDTLQWSKEQK